MAALYVMLHHASSFALTDFVLREPMPHSLAFALKALHFGLLGYGHYAVVVFIVLSGFCLMLPVARSADGTLPGGFNSYLVRRARRILPPYYAALAFSIAIAALAPGLRSSAGVWWDQALPALTVQSLLSHLLLIHNHTSACLALNPPMWSVAVEWQIYFLFPLLLLPVWRRWGTAAAVAVAAITSIGASYLAPSWVGGLFPWMLAAFAFGMAGAVVASSSGDGAASWRTRTPWGLLTAGSTVVVILLNMLSRASWSHIPWVAGVTGPLRAIWPVDCLVAFATACLLMGLAHTDAGSAPVGVARKLLERPAARALGAFSYSLYLIHAPLLGALSAFCRVHHVRASISAALLIGVAPIGLLVVAHLFSRVFEQPFLSQKRHGQAIQTRRP